MMMMESAAPTPAAEDVSSPTEMVLPEVPTAEDVSPPPEMVLPQVEQVVSMKRRSDGEDDVPPTKKLCTACNVAVSKDHWARHLKRRHDGEDVGAPPARKKVDSRRYCGTCDLSLNRDHWSRHIQSGAHRLKAALTGCDDNEDHTLVVTQPSEDQNLASTSGATAAAAATVGKRPVPASRKVPAGRKVTPKKKKPTTSSRVTAAVAAGSSRPQPPATFRPQPPATVCTQPSPPSTSTSLTTAAGMRPVGFRRASVQPLTSARPARACKKQPGTAATSLKVKCPVCERAVLPVSVRKHMMSNRCLRTYQITETRSRVVRKYGATEVEYKMKVGVNVQVEPAIGRMIEMAKERGGYRPGDRLQVIARHPDLHHDISTVVGGERNVTAHKLVDHVAKIVSSNQNITVSGMTWLVKIINMPRGSRSGKKILNLATDLHTKRCIVQIRNEDNMCAPRAIVTALTYHGDSVLGHDLTSQEKKSVRKGRKLQTDLANELCDWLGGCPEEGFSLQEIRASERLLEVQIKIVCAENLNAVIYEGEEADKVLYLYKVGNHFHVITSMSAFLGRSYYCDKCNTAYSNNHLRCKAKPMCKLCRKPSHDEQHAKLYCSACNRYCYDAECVANHAEVCAELYKCTVCNRLRRRDTEHSCSTFYCRNCDDFVSSSHECHMQRLQAKGGVCSSGCFRCNGVDEGSSSAPDKKKRKCTYTERYLFFDYEAVQETGVHVPNLVKVQHFDGDSWTFPDNETFCEWLINDRHRSYTCIAHNAKGYDSHFILRYCVENTVKPYTIYSGSKLVLLEIPSINLKIIDSANFVASPLSAFPRTFGLTELRKGYFPHYFNTRANQTYVGPIPDVEYYGVDAMKPAARAEFLRWHAERVAEGYVFDFAEEFHRYCESDVDILRRGCLELRSQFLEIANVDPFCYLTIAGVCMAVYRSKYLRSETIGVVKQIETREMYSKQSIAWLSTFGDGVRHALNGGEVSICGAKVDGYCAETKTVYQYHGCFWHGCLDCYAPSTFNRVRRECMGDLRNRTAERTERLRRAGYNVVEKWECSWLPEYKRVANTMSSAPVVVVEALNPRDAFYGGRTNAAKLKVSGSAAAGGGEKVMRYIDVVSLYPTVMYYDQYPVGHPVKLKLTPAATAYKRSWYGFAKCKVVAPRGLYHPVLPVRFRNKLLFPLCLRCAEDKVSDCSHTDDERSFVGTWTTTELEKALDKGYKVVEVYEVWHFAKRSNELFRGYVKDFLKIKLETSPWQQEHSSVEEYVTAVKSGMAIDLDVDKVENNPGKRAVSKICLNSLWGKFGQRTDLTQTKYVTDVLSFYKILLDPRLEVSNVIFLNENIVQLTYKEKGLFREDPANVNVYVAAFTTASARLRLYEMLDRLGERVVYYDTDSVVYIDDVDGSGTHNTVPTGTLLGQWCDELSTDDYIVDWVSTGPKSYAYRTRRGAETCKIKGFTLNWANSQRLNMNTMKALLVGEMEKTTIVYDQITRDRLSKTLINKKSIKSFRLQYDKRRALQESDGVVDTLPWGY